MDGSSFTYDFIPREGSPIFLKKKIKPSIKNFFKIEPPLFGQNSTSFFP
jgi:hypothetical protein